MTQRQKLGLTVTLLALAAIAAVTLVPTPEQAEQASDTSLWCLVCGQLGVVDVLLNVLLFLPLGVGLRLLGFPVFRALLIIGFTTLTVEVLQMAVVTGRDASLSDLITNTIGGSLGYALGVELRRLVLPSPRTGRWLAGLGLLVWLGQEAFAGWALHRDLPASVYYGQWAPELGQFDRFTGQVVSVTLNGMPLGTSRFRHSDQVRGELDKPVSGFRVEAVSGELTAKTAPIFSIFDDHQREIALVGVNRQDIVFHLRTRLDRLRLRSPSILVPGAVPSTAGQPLVIEAGMDHSRFMIKVDHAGGRYQRSVALSPSWGWSFVLPFSYDFGATASLLTALWLLGFWVPIGYWTGAAARGSDTGWPWWAALGIIMGTGLAMIPRLMGLEIVGPVEWTAALGGAALGWLVARRVGREFGAS